MRVEAGDTFLQYRRWYSSGAPGPAPCPAPARSCAASGMVEKETGSECTRRVTSRETTSDDLNLQGREERERGREEVERRGGKERGRGREGRREIEREREREEGESRVTDIYT